MASRRIQCVRACLVAVALGSIPVSARQLPADAAAAVSPADRNAHYIVTRDRYESGRRVPIEVVIASKADAAATTPEIFDTATRALTMLDEWLGPLPLDRLTIVDVPWNSTVAPAASPGVVVVRSRWLTSSRDRSLDREIIAGVARQYWLDKPGTSAFIDGLSMYLAGRAIDSVLEGSQFYADRYVGGFLPYALRAVSLSPTARDMRPRLRRYPELETATAAAQKAARAIEVAERYLGWPAIQQAVEAFRRRAATSPADFATIVSEQRGRDTSWLFRDTLDEQKHFDYALTSLHSQPSGAGEFNVRLSIDRLGSAEFARPLPVETRFADGTTLRDSWDAAEPHATIEYVSRAPAIAAAIDPDVILVLDEALANNVVRQQPEPWNRLGLKLACDWALWLQNLMLTSSGLA